MIAVEPFFQPAHRHPRAVPVDGEPVHRGVHRAQHVLPRRPGLRLRRGLRLLRGPAAAAASRPEPGVPPSAAARGQSGVGGLGAPLPVGLLLLRQRVPGVVELGLQPLEGGVLPGLLRPLPGLVVQEERVAVGLGHLGRRGTRVDGGEDGEGPDVEDVLAVGLGDRECRL